MDARMHGFKSDIMEVSHTKQGINATNVLTLSHKSPAYRDTTSIYYVGRPFKNLTRMRANELLRERRRKKKEGMQ